MTQKTIQALNDKGLVYTTADKGNKLVIMNKENYDKNMKTMLAGEEFVELKSDPTKQYINSY